jgi:uncharacterized protein YgbK (DUF1537 family)
MLPKTQDPILVVAGSPTPQTQAQIDGLRGLGPIVLVSADTPVPPRPSGHHEVIVVCTPPTIVRDSGESADVVAQTVAVWATDLASGSAAPAGQPVEFRPGALVLPGEPVEFRPGALVLAGGAVARLVCERLGAHSVRLNGELQPGIPFGQLQGGRWDGLRVVTKAGGFGTPQTLLDVVRALGVSSVAEPTHD